MDLFTPVIPQDSWHPNFANLMKQRNEWNEAVLSDWADGFVDRDGKFVKEFQLTFDACFWELYLYAVLKSRQLEVDFNKPAPDFSVTGPQSFALEATTASHAHGTLPESHPIEIALIPTDLNELNRQAILRLTNSLRSKYEKYQKQYSALPHVAEKPFIIALAPFDRPQFNLACQRAIEAVLFNYYVDEESYIATGTPNSLIPKSTLESVTKDNRTVIDLGFFQNDYMPELSAILFSTCASWGKVRALSLDPNPGVYFKALRHNPHSSMPHEVHAPKSEYTETLLDGLRVYHNPHANYPLDPAIFRSDEVFQAYFCQDSNEWVYEVTERHLTYRKVETYHESDK